jgi:hypothetical protein
MEEYGRSISIRLNFVQDGQINRARLVVVGIRPDAVRTQFQHVRDAQPRPRTEAQKCGIHITQPMQPVKRLVDPAVDRHTLLSGLIRMCNLQVVAGQLVKARFFLPRFEMRGTVGVMAEVA